MELIQTRMDAAPLKSGSTVEVADKYVVLMEMMKDDGKDSIDYLNIFDLTRQR